MKRLFINLGYGRSGTTFLYNLCRLNLPDIDVWHERISARAARRELLFRMSGTEQTAALPENATELRKFLNEVRDNTSYRPLLILGGTTSHLAPLLIQEVGEDLTTVFHVHRHPFLVSAAALTSSGAAMWNNIPIDGSDPGQWKLTPFSHRSRLSTLRSRWDGMNPFSRMMFQWAEQTQYALDFPQLFPSVDFATFPSADLFVNPAKFISFLALRMGRTVESCQVPPKTNATWNRNREMQPLSESIWKQATEIEEFRTIASILGYDCSPEYLVAILEKYRLPRGVGSFLRYHLRYWQVRQIAANCCRRLGLMPTSDVEHDGDTPRPTIQALQELASHNIRRIFRH